MSTEIHIEPIGEKKQSIDFIFKIMVLLTTSFSGVTTYLGFSKDLEPPLSLSIAIIIGLGLFLLNFKIREASQNNNGMLRDYIIAFFLLLPFSFISNVNALYSNFLAKDIVKITQEKAWSVFDEGTISLKSSLKNSQFSETYKEKERELNEEINKLKNQITNKNNIGMGKIAESHLSTIESKFNLSVTRLNPPKKGSSYEKYKVFANDLEKNIRTQFDLKNSKEDTTEAKLLISDIDKKREIYENKIKYNEFKRIYTDGMKNDLSSLKLKVEAIIKEKINIPPIDSTPDDIGAFNYTINNFINGINKTAMILSVFLALLLDLLTPMLSFLLYRKKGATNEHKKNK